MESTTTLRAPVAIKPKMRGLSHQIAFFFSIPAAIILMIVAPTTRALTAGAIYGATLCTLFGVSALYHRPFWPEPQRSWLRRVDHSAIYLLIAGTTTPFCLVLEEGRLQVLLVVWIGAGVGVARAIFWPRAPKPLIAVTYVALGWAIVPWIGRIGRAVGATPVALVLVGGVLYSLGALVYAKRRPNPWPRVFGFHEIFHLLVIVAAVLHFVAIVCVSQTRL